MPRTSSIAAVSSAIALAASLAACGGEERLDESQLPARLAEALPRLEAAEFDVDAVATGPDEIPALLVKDGDAAVVLATGEDIGKVDAPASVPPTVRDEGGEGFDLTAQTICAPDEYIAATAGAGAMASRVIRLARFCR